MAFWETGLQWCYWSGHPRYARSHTRDTYRKRESVDHGMLRLVSWKRQKLDEIYIMLDYIGSNRILLGQIGSYWIKMDHIKMWISRSRDAEASKLEEKKMDWMYIKLDRIWSNWILLDLIGSYWIILDQIGSKWITFDKPQLNKDLNLNSQVMKEILLKQAICDGLGSLVQRNFLSFVNLAENTCFKWTTFRQQGVTIINIVFFSIASFMDLHTTIDFWYS